MIGQRLVVVADSHLGSAPTGDEEAFLAFLDAVPTLGDSLLLAGDIYDFWFTYRRVIPRRAIQVTAGLIHLARRFPVYLLGGNHDRWGDAFWRQDAGVEFDPWQLRFRVGEHEVLAVHGDGLHAERPTASFLSRMLASPGVIAAFRTLPLEVGFRIADRLRHDPGFAASRPDVAAAAAARQEQWARKRMAADPTIDTLIMGHTHRPAAVEIASGRWYLNPGAWLDGHRYATLSAEGAQLAQFS
ncbi:MAG: UDP-2,3-diacylglucosamine diphosphatase [Gemmatimonadota bacterium]